MCSLIISSIPVAAAVAGPSRRASGRCASATVHQLPHPRLNRPAFAGGSAWCPGSPLVPQMGSKGAMRLAAAASTAVRPPLSWTELVAPSQGGGASLESELATLDKLLAAGDQKEAVALMARLAAVEEGEGESEPEREPLVVGFGRANQTPKRAYTIEELRLNKIEPEKYLSPEDTTINGVRQKMQIAYIAGVAALAYAFHLDTNQLTSVVLGSIFLMGVDQVANMGAGESLLLDSVGRLLSPTYGPRVAAHEAGHFLVAYLVGILPEGYTLSGADAIRKYNAINVQAGTTFCDRDFQAEVSRGQLSSTSLDKYCCVALAGVTTEFLEFGQAEGGLSDIMQLDRLLQALGFTQKKSDSQVRWAVLNTTTLLKRHRGVHRELTRAMEQGRSVGECIGVIERELAKAELV